MRARLMVAGVVVGLSGIAALGMTAPAVAAPRAAKPKVSGVHTIGGKVYAEGIACPTGKPVTKANCDIVGDTTAGTNAISVVHHGKPGGLTTATPGGGAITCPSATVCVVAGAETLSSAPGGVVGTVEWLTSGQPSVTVEVTGTSDLTGVACPSPTSCVAAGYVNGKATANGTKQYGEVAIVTNSTTTVHAHRVAKTETLSGVACGSATKCVVVGFGGTITTHHAVVVAVSKGKIGSARSAPGANQLNDVSCGSPTTCWATGEHQSAKGRVTNIVSKVVKGKPKHALGGPQDIGAIACVTATTCYLGGGKPIGSGQNSTGEVFRLVSGHVRSKRLVKHTMAFSGISCPTKTSCIATGPQSFHNPGVNSYWRSDLAVLKV